MGEEGLSGVFHGEDVVEDNDLAKFISGETELIFDFDESLGLEFVIKFITLFGGELFGELEAFEEVVDNFMEFDTVDGRLLLEDSGKVTGVEGVRLMDAKMFGDED